MTVLYNAYPTEAAARRVVESLRADGVQAGEIRLLTGSPLGDVRREPVGGFGGPVDPDAPIGTYAGRVLLRRQGAGSFAGDPDQQRQGSFADSDPVAVVTYSDDAERARVTGLRGARRLLRRAALSGNAVESALAELGIGHAVLLVDAAELAPGDERRALDRLARAA